MHYNYFRDYDAEIGRYLESDPIGLNGGMSTFGYVGGDPLRFVDPYGLAGLDWLWEGVWNVTGGWSPDQSTVDFAAGFGDTISFGVTSGIRDLADIGSVNKCSSAYSGGEWAGIGWGFAFGGAGLVRGGFRAELGNWKQGGEWFFREGTKGPHFHFGRGLGLQTHHLPWQSGNWWRNFQNMVRQGKAADDLGNIGAVIFGFAVVGNGIVQQGCGCEQ